MPEVIISGPEGRLEGKYFHHEAKGAPAAVILHPHPKHGGTMNNKVAYHLYQAFANNGFSVLRFNFRGVGRSEGEFDNGIGELTDAATTLDWLQQQNPDAATFWVGGFSFGAWLSMQLLMRRPELEGFISIAPPANLYDFNFLAPCPRSGMIVQGNQDSIVNEEDVFMLADKLNNQKNIEVRYDVVNGADHFFRNSMDELDSVLDDYIGGHIGAIMKRGQIKPDRRRRQLPKNTQTTPPVATTQS